ncbi:MAG: TadE/TadG family type IV pilus assembly protein [Rhizobiaceae bacterium]
MMIMLASRFSGLRSLLADRRAAAAVEFAFVAPVLLSLYFVTMEVAQGIEANKKVGRVGSMVADLITQQQSINKSELNAIMSIGESILQPYNRTRPEIEVTAINITDDPNPQVLVSWSRKLSNGSTGAGATKNTTTTVPAKLKIRNSFLIRVTSRLSYTPVIAWTADQKANLGLAAAFDGIQMGETYYLRPRMTQTIACSDC